MPVAALDAASGRLDEARVAAVSRPVIETLERARAEVAMRVCAMAAAVPDEATAEQCYDAWLARLPAAKQDALTDECARCADDAEREATMARQLDALLPGEQAIVIGLKAREDLNHCYGLVLEPSADGRFPTRVQSGEDQEELVRVRPRNLWPADS